MQSTTAPQQYATAVHKAQVLITLYTCKKRITILRNRIARTLKIKELGRPRKDAKDCDSFAAGHDRGCTMRIDAGVAGAGERIAVAAARPFLYGLGNSGGPPLYPHPEERLAEARLEGRGQ